MKQKLRLAMAQANFCVGDIQAKTAEAVDAAFAGR